jgi:hypothetical protein
LDTSEALIPRNRRELITVLIMLVSIIPLYLGRIWIYQSLESERGPLGYAGLIFLPICCGALLLVVVLLGVVAAIIYRRTRKVTSILVFGGGIIIALIIPLPVLPRVVYAEEALFYAQRAQFEEVVNFARQDELECSELGCDYYSRILPQEFSHLSEEGHISVSREKQSGGLIVEFRPFTFYYPVIYFEISEDVDLGWHSECWGTRGVRELDEHWYLCMEDWL